MKSKTDPLQKCDPWLNAVFDKVAFGEAVELPADSREVLWGMRTRWYRLKTRWLEWRNWGDDPQCTYLKSSYATIQRTKTGWVLIIGQNSAIADVVKKYEQDYWAKTFSATGVNPSNALDQLAGK